MVEKEIVWFRNDTLLSPRAFHCAQECHGSLSARQVGTATQLYLSSLESLVACISTADSQQLTQQTGPCCQLKSSSHSFEKYSANTYSVPGLGAKESTHVGIVHGRMLHKAFAQGLGYSKHSRNGGVLHILSHQSNHMRWPLAVSYLGVRKLETQ